MFKHELSSGRKISFREPRVVDRRRLIEGLKPGEQVDPDVLLASICIVDIDGEEPADPDPRYMMDDMSVKDSQEYVNLFLYMFTVTTDDVERIKDAAKKLLSPATVPSSAQS